MLGDPCGEGLAPQAETTQGERDFGEDRGLEELPARILKQVADPPLLQVGRRRPAADADAAAAGTQQTGQAAQQGGLAGAVGGAEIGALPPVQRQAGLLPGRGGICGGHRQLFHRHHRRPRIGRGRRGRTGQMGSRRRLGAHQLQGAVGTQVPKAVDDRQERPGAMLAEQNRQPLPLQPGDYLHQAFQSLAVQLSGRFVEDQQGRLQYQLGGDEEPVLLPHRQTDGGVLEGEVEPDGVEGGADPLGHLRRGKAEIFQTEGDLGTDAFGEDLGLRVLQHQADRGTCFARNDRKQEAPFLPPRRKQLLEGQSQRGFSRTAGAGEPLALPLRELDGEFPQGPVAAAGPGVGVVVQPSRTGHGALLVQKRTSAPA